MKTIIYRKSDLICVGVVQDNTTIDWEIENNVIPNFKGNLNDYDFIDVDYSKFKLIRGADGNVFAIESGLSIDELKNKIILELSDLDKLIPRVLEDIIQQSGYTLHPSKLAVLEQKKELRKQLQGLED